MSYLTDRDFATLFLDGATLFLIISIAFTMKGYKRKKRDDDKYFFMLRLANCLVAIGDMMGYIFEDKPWAFAPFVRVFGMTLFYFSFVSMSLIWVHYCRVRFKYRGVASESFLRPEYIPVYITLICIILNVFTGWIFRYDADSSYHRGVLFGPMYLVLISYVGGGFVHIAKYRSRRSNKSLIPVWVYALPIVFGPILTFAIPGAASFAAIGAAMTVTFTHLGTLNEVLE